MKSIEEAYDEMWARFQEGRKERGAILRHYLARGATLEELNHLLKRCAEHKRVHVRLVEMGPPGPYYVLVGPYYVLVQA